MTDEYMSPEEMEVLFDGLAVGSGRTRAAFESDLAQLRALAAAPHHLSFMEADHLDDLPPERTEHLDTCTYCRRLVETIYVRPIDVATFEEKVREQLAAMPPVRRRLVFAPAMLLVGILLGAVGAKGLLARSTPGAPQPVQATRSLETSPVSARAVPTNGVARSASTTTESYVRLTGSVRTAPDSGHVTIAPDDLAPWTRRGSGTSAGVFRGFGVTDRASRSHVQALTLRAPYAWTADERGADDVSLALRTTLSWAAGDDFARRGVRTHASTSINSFVRAGHMLLIDNFAGQFSGAMTDDDCLTADAPDFFIAGGPDTRTQLAMWHLRQARLLMNEANPSAAFHTIASQ